MNNGKVTLEEVARVSRYWRDMAKSFGAEATLRIGTPIEFRLTTDTDHMTRKVWFTPFSNDKTIRVAHQDKRYNRERGFTDKTYKVKKIIGGVIRAAATSSFGEVERRLGNNLIETR